MATELETELGNRVAALEGQMRTVCQSLTTIQTQVASLSQPAVEIHRDAGTGRFVTEEHAEENPGTTVRETR